MLSRNQMILEGSSLQSRVRDLSWLQAHDRRNMVRVLKAAGQPQPYDDF